MSPRLRIGIALPIALLLLGVLTISAAAVPACTDTFTGPANGDWATAANWTSVANGSVHQVPTSTDVACLGGATVTVAAGAQHADSVQGQGGSLKLTGGTLTLASATNATTVVGLSLDNSGGLSASAPVNVTGNFEWGGCASCGNEIALNATVTQTGGGSFTIDGAGTGLSGPTLTGGSITTSSPVSITNGSFGSTGSETLTTTSTITLGPGIQLSALSPSTTITAGGIAPQTGTTNTYGFWGAQVVLTGGTTTVAPNTMLQASALTVQAGTVDDEGEILPAPGFALTATLDDATLAGAGSLNGNLTNVAGTVMPAFGALNQLTVTGGYTQDAGGTLAIGVDGNDTSLLKVNGAATLTGTMTVTDESGFSPSAGEQFTVVLTGPTETGTFTVSGPDASAYAAQYGSQFVRLVANGPGGGTTTTTTSSETTTTGPTLTTTTTTTGTAPTTTAAHVTTLGVPVDTVAPVISGVPTPGHDLSCSSGSWTNQPSVYAYRWQRNGQPLTMASTRLYGVQIADEGGALTCTVTAANPAGAGAASTSAAVVVAMPGTLTCPRPRGRLSGPSVGPLSLGFSRAHARRTLTRFAVTGNGFDDFCLYGGWGIRVGYPTAKVLHGLTVGNRLRVSGRIVLALTANPFYALDGVRPGMSLAAAARRLRVGRGFHVGLNDWYLAPGTRARGVLKVRHRVIQEVGVADLRLTAGNRTSQRRFIASFTRI